MKTKTFLFGIIVIFMAVSCEDYLNVDQPDIIEQEQAFSDKNSTRLSLLGIYGLMAELVEPMFLAGEVRADLVIANKSAESFMKEFSNNSFSASNPYVSPKPFYTIINNANDFIKEFEGLLANQKMDTSVFIKYKSELVAIRVWSQYQVAKIFGSCKYYTHVIGSEDSTTVTKYSFEDKDFMQVLIDDLTYSDTNNFTANNEEVIWQAIRFSDYYVDALMGELYMDMGDYENAVDKYDDVILNRRIVDRFKMTTKWSPAYAWYFELFEEDMSISLLKDNAVFMVAFDNKYNQRNELWNWTVSSNYQLSPSDWFANKFEENGSIELEEWDPRYLSVYWYSNSQRDYAISKYADEDKPFILTRTARISLLKAFCLNAMDEDSKALKELDKVRKRINFPVIDQSEMPSDPAQAKIWIENIIIDELAYENAFEGQRWFDIMRVATRRNNVYYLANQVAQKYPEESRAQIQAKLTDKANWYIPVFE